MSGQLDLFSAEESPVLPVLIEPLYFQGLNEQQKQAVSAPADEALQVLAGAGTGKTELISRRFVKLALDFEKMDVARPTERILVVTFTNDAALGMRERIQQRLLECGGSDLTPDVWISTFHQFCLRLLRTHALAVGLPPGFSVLNPLEQQMLFNRVVDGMVVGEYLDLSDVLERTGLASVIAADVLSVDALTQSGFQDIERLLDAKSLYALVNRIKTAGLSPKEFYETAIHQSRQLTERLKTLPVPHDKDLGAPENLEAKISAWHDGLRPWAHADWNPIGEAVRKAEESGKKLTASVYKEELPGLVKLYLAARSYEPLTPDFAALDETLRLEEKLIGIVTAVYALYQQALLAEGTCDFDDLINHSITLLSNDAALRARYREQFKAIIVDEFQDSNGSQLRLLELLIQDGAKNLTVVGDEKQSIYAFRFAQPENLDLVFQNGAHQKINLQTNYRSRPSVLAVANHLTDRITTRPNQRLEVCEQHAEVHEPNVIWMNFDAMDEVNGKPAHKPMDEQRAMEAEYIATEITRLMREENYRYCDIAVLVKSHAKAENIQKTLEHFEIPAIRQKNMGFFQEAVIKDAMALLRLMNNLGDDGALVRILQGKLNQKQILSLIRLKQTGEAQALFDVCLLLHHNPNRLPELPVLVAEAVGDLAVQLQAIRKLKTRLSPVQLFLKLAQTVGLIDAGLPALQRQQQRVTLNMFERLLYLFGQNRPLQPTLDEVLETLEQYAANPNQELPVSADWSGENAVRIMTVFAAKGLEFPVVFAAYTEKGQVRSGGDDSSLLFDPQYAGKAGFGLILAKVNGIPNLKREIYQKCWQIPRGKTEAQRVFYVALTRAMERLYVIRGSQSFSWTDPSGYPAESIEIFS